MMKHVIVAAMCAVLGTACGLPNIGPLDDEAQVEVVNAEAGASGTEDTLGDSSDDEESGSTILGSAAVPNDGGGSDDADGGLDTPVAGGPNWSETATGSAISLASTEDKMSTNPDNPTTGWGYLTVDGAFATSQLDEVGAAAGSKFVVIDYQLLGAEGGNFFDRAFQLEAEGQVYPPSTNINLIAAPGGVVNSSVTFEVPATATSLQLRGGVPVDSVDGFTALVDIELSPVAGTPTPAPVITDEAVEAIAWDITLTSPEATMSTNLTRPADGAGTLTIDSATATARLDDEGAGPEWKFVVVDYQLLGIEGGNFFDNAFRLTAEDELYPTLTSLNEIVGPGTVNNGSLVFRVPRSAVALELQAGATDFQEDGLTATFEIVLPDIDAEQSDSSSSTEPVEEAEPLTDQEVEATATSITLTSDEATMSTNPTRPTNGWGTLEVDTVSSTAKIDENGAGPDFKFVIVEFQLIGGESGNFFESSFRVEADGELYPPVSRLNEIVGPGDVFNGSIVFRVPRSAGELRLEGGVAAGTTDGLTAVYQIRFW